MASERTQAAEIANDVEMATDGHNDRNSEEEMNLLPSFKRPFNKPRHTQSLPSRLAATEHQLRSHRQQGAPSTNEENENLGSHEQDGTQESHEENENLPRPEVVGKNSKRYIKMAHTALEKQQNAYGVILVLLAGMSSVSILQPPGSFDSEGYIRDDALRYLLFASLSFVFACTGLFALVVGSATLYDPVFYAPNTSDGIATPKEIMIIEDNISRVNRSKLYLLLSLVFCVLAFYAGVLTVVKISMYEKPAFRWSSYSIYMVALIIVVFELYSGKRQSFLALRSLGQP